MVNQFQFLSPFVSIAYLFWIVRVLVYSEVETCQSIKEFSSKFTSAFGMWKWCLNRCSQRRLFMRIEQYFQGDLIAVQSDGNRTHMMPACNASKFLRILQSRFYAYIAYALIHRITTIWVNASNLKSYLKKSARNSRQKSPLKTSFNLRGSKSFVVRFRTVHMQIRW